MGHVRGEDALCDLTDYIYNGYKRLHACYDIKLYKDGLFLCQS